MNDRQVSTEKIPTKKEQIWKLLSEGRHSADDIARITRTTIGYVWKEKSRFKSELTTTREIKLISSSGRDSMPSALVKNRSSRGELNIPEVEQECTKKLYFEFKSAKKPVDIIAEYGYHPGSVETEYARFLRLGRQDFSYLQKRLFRHFMSRSQDNKLPLIHKGEAERSRSIDTLITLIESMLKRKRDQGYDEGRHSVIYDLSHGKAPEGWSYVYCSRCNEPLEGLIVDPRETPGRGALSYMKNWNHAQCATY